MLIGLCGKLGTYCDRWVNYCESRGIPYRRIDFNSSEFISQCAGLDGLLWHWGYDDPVQMPVARQIIMALELSGLRVFPNVATSWHYDDKISQKFLLEAIDAPIVPSWVFTDQTEAISWINAVTWPKVFKLKGGAGSSNVRLVSGRSEAVKLCKRAFGSGFQLTPNYFNDAQKRIRRARTQGDLVKRILNSPRALMRSINHRNIMPTERGYIYFQEFMPNNSFDTRITIIGERAFGFRRFNRPNDFRASGSGNIQYDKDKIDMRCVELAFQVSERLGTQSLAFDFLFDLNEEVRICELSYCYQSSAVHACNGYWDRSGFWHSESIWPEDAIIDDFLSQMQ